MANKPFFGFRGARLDFAIFFVASFDLLLFGYDQGVTGGLLTLNSFTKTFPEICTSGSCYDKLTSSEQYHRSLIQGVAVSSYNLGCFLGAIITIKIGDILGRRKMIFMGSAIMIVGGILQCSAFSLTQLIIGRVITGVGNGFNSSTVPVWQAECSKAHQRGPAVMGELCIVVGGVALSYWLDFGFSYLEPSSAAWRVPIAFQLVFSIFVVCTIMTMPESPRWLVLENHNVEALEVLGALNDLPPDHREVLTQFETIKATVQASTKGTYRDLFSVGKTKNFQRTVLAYSIQVLQQLTGINLITYYASTIYENEIGLSAFLSRILAACNGTEYFLATMVPVVLVERVGRRPLLLIGSVGMAISMIILTICTSVGGNQAGVAAAVFLFVFNTFFALGWCGLPWLIPAELVPLEIRAQANALSTSANWIFNFMVVMITPVAFNSIGARTYIIFAVFNAITAPLVYLFYPETARRSLEEMDLIFAKSKGWRDVVKVAEREPNHFGRHGEVLMNILPEVVEDISEAEKKTTQHEEVVGMKNAEE
ncbi:general substrate transporter [Limtongia smithiae]|uniref:general substrate transporter n=1 Tax=Limtongia smithiae TaxID=1125753 RepID=UPI0034CE1B2E